jgi:hypothetical protein
MIDFKFLPVFYKSYMGYDSGFDSDSDTSSIFSRMSGKELGIIVIIAAIGGFFAVQAMFGFPIKDIIRKEVTEEAKVVLKNDQGTCVVEGADREPRGIPNCPYKIGDTLVVTFKQGTAPIEKHHIKD